MSRCWRSWIRRRICALHRDVEGRGRLVGDDEARPAGEGDGDEDALAHAARQFVRVGREHARGLADGDVGEKIEGVGVGGAAGEAELEAEHGGDLLADPLHRVERGHRVLRDQRDVAAEERAARALGHGDEVAAVEQDRAAGDAGAAGQEVEDGAGDHRFSGAGFADEAAHFAGRYGEIDAAKERQRGAAADGDVEVVDLESGGHRRCTGSKVARRPSPRRLKPSTVRMMQPIGRASSHGIW